MNKQINDSNVTRSITTENMIEEDDKSREKQRLKRKENKKNH